MAMQVRQYLNRKNYYLILKSNLDIAFGGRGEIKVNTGQYGSKIEHY